MSSILGGFAGISGGSIGRASVDLVLNSTLYNAQLAEAEGKTATAGKSMQSGLTNALGDARAALGTAGTAAVAFGAVAVLAIGKAIGVTSDWAAEVRALQRVTGQTAESASALAAAGEALGLNVTQLTTGFGLLAKNIVNGSANLEKYGVATKDAQGNILPFDAVLANVSDKFATLQAGPEQAAFAMNIFGRSGKDLIPILARGSAGLKELEDSARSAGLIMSQDDLNASKDLAIAQRELGESFKGAAIQIGKVFVPVLTGLVKGFKSMVNFVTQTFGPAFAAIRKSFSDVAQAFGDLYTALGPLGPLLGKVLALLVGAPLALVIVPLEALAFAFEQTAKFTEAFAHMIGPVIAGAINIGVDAINILIAAYNKVVDISNTLLRTHFDHIEALQHVSTAADGAASSMDGAASAADKEAAAQARAAAAAEKHTRALQAQRLQLLQSAGGVLGLVASLQQVNQDETTLQHLRDQGKRGTAAYSDAVVQATTDTLSFRTQLRQQAADMLTNGDNIGKIKNVLKEMATQAGISGEDFRRALGGPLDEVLAKLDNLKNKRVNISVDTSQIDAANRKLLDLHNMFGPVRY
jgi:hypothetical protein